MWCVGDIQKTTAVKFHCSCHCGRTPLHCMRNADVLLDGMNYGTHDSYIGYHETSAYRLLLLNITIEDSTVFDTCTLTGNTIACCMLSSMLCAKRVQNFLHWQRFPLFFADVGGKHPLTLWFLFDEPCCIESTTPKPADEWYRYSTDNTCESMDKLASWNARHITHCDAETKRRRKTISRVLIYVDDGSKG